ncbi:AAA family ATPase [Leptospira sp. 2 VSF19]|uniref:AAA family ATPase n=1 Tax=Leptospira soteropolitanensis TaxID=2950025 RepID=A0AAW5VQ47_9LEPT|nr:ATP-binding protein [Leptospira soteropolitanensis]MCW7494597.1 AAA family ATPase [Leptospira soteropolitanensis]MCW7502191.1 AAA family ATPase [Leptospira soteropolitanensis]MCW7524379.1 AAA family ATPase [Leptospira soteropolitanensis]MCW7528245.1 AAA family ATPase [Leptospira soteropolitanensis]MCW7532162.1 AAA family ATPase [Leptospira soteropolitanensis]
MKLKIENFGIFSKKEFPIEKVTVFTGPNESGKTTILDAFVSALVKVVGSTKYGAILNARYNSDRNSDLGIPKLTLSQNLYLNSLVIREGNMDVGSEKELISTIEQTIFDSGYNPSQLKEQVEQLSAKTGTRKSAKEWNLALSELNVAKQKFDASEFALNKISSQFVDLPNLEIERQKLKLDLANSNSEQNKLQTKLLELKEAEQHNETDRIFGQLLQWETLKSSSQQEEKILNSGLDQKSKQLDGEIKSFEQKQNLSKERLADLESKLESLLIQKKQIEQKSKKLESFFDFFETWKQSIRKFQEESPAIQKTTWNPLYRSLAAGFGVFGIFSTILILFSEFSSWTYIFPVALILSAVGFLFFAKVTKSERDESKWNEMVRRIATEMETKTLGEWKPDSLSMESLSLSFQRYEREYTKQKLESENMFTAITNLEEEISRLRAEDKKLSETILNKEKELAGVWREVGVQSLSELSELFVQIRLKGEKLRTLEDSLKLESKKWGTADFGEWKLKLKDKLNDWEKKGISKSFSSEDRFTKQKLENETQALTDHIRNLERTLMELEKKLETGKAVLESQMVPAQKEWEQSKRDLETKEKKKNDLEVNFQALEVLSEIFSEMQAESTDKMSSLVKSLQVRMDALKGSLPAKQIQWNGFSDEIQISSGSAKESLAFGNLSTGTKEQISYVLRLEYAFRIGKQFNLPYLLLDEPFRHMDVSRRDAALTYTLQCISSAEEDWKVVFFSFDEELVSKINVLAKEYNLPCQIHELTKQVS